MQRINVQNLKRVHKGNAVQFTTNKMHGIHQSHEHEKTKQQEACCKGVRRSTDDVTKIAGKRARHRRATLMEMTNVHLGTEWLKRRHT